MNSPEPHHNGDHLHLLTLQEVGAELKLTVKAVRHLVNTSQLKADYMFGQWLRLRRSELDRFLATALRPALYLEPRRWGWHQGPS